MSNGEKKGVTLPVLLRSLAGLTRKIKGSPESNEIYLRVLLRSGGELDVHRLAIWEQKETRRTLIFLVSKDKCVLTDFDNVEQLEYLYTQPNSNAIGFKIPEAPIELPPAWSDFLGLKEQNNET